MVTNNKLNKKIFYAIYLIGGGVLFSAICFYNGYPLLTSDSGEYIDILYDFHQSYSRLETYAFFVKHISLKSSLFLVIIGQSIILTYVLDNFIDTVIKKKLKLLNKFFIYVLLVAFTGVSWYSSQIMSDIFTSIGLISILIIALNNNLKIYQKIIFFIIAVFSMLTHKSNLLLYTFFTVSLVLITLLKNFKSIYFSKLKTVMLLLILIMGWFSVPIIKNVFLGNYQFDSKAHAFYSARMTETGLLMKILDKECEDNPDNVLCKNKDKIPYKRSVFLWSKKSPLKKYEGWTTNKAQFNSLIKKSFKDFDCLISHVGWAFQGFFSQLTNVRVGRLLWNQSDNWEVYNPIKKHFKYEYNAFRNAKQNNGTLKFKRYNRNMFFVLIFSALIILAFLNKFNSLSKKNKILILSILAIIIFNAALTAPLAGVSSRYQGKIIWLLPFFIILLLIENKKNIIKYISKSLKKMFN